MIRVDNLESQSVLSFENIEGLQSPGGEDTPIYGRYRYVPRRRVGFLRFWIPK